MSSHEHASVMIARRRAWGLAAVSLGFLMITLDATIVNVALGPIVSDLGGSLTAAQWIVNGYTLAFAALLLSAGSLADRHGARAGYVAGLATFTVGSVACATAPSLTALVAARIVQGSGAAMLMPCSLALISHTFPPGDARRRALSAWGGASGLGLAAGPVLGGLLVAAVGWRAIFVVNVPIAAITFALLVRHVAETDRHRRALDVPGQLLNVATLGALTAGCIVAGEKGWVSAPALTLLVGGIVAAAGFVAVQRAVTHPMVPGSLFAQRQFTCAVAIGGLFNFCIYGALFCLAVFLHDARHLSALRTGLALLPLTVTVGTGATLAGALIARVGEWRTIGIGLTTGLAGACLVALTADAPLGVLVLTTVLLGTMSLAMPAMTAEAMRHAPAHSVGVASGVLNASRQSGGALGVAVTGSLLAIGDGLDLAVAFAVVALAFAAALTLAAVGAASGSSSPPAAGARSRRARGHDRRGPDPRAERGTESATPGRYVVTTILPPE